MESIIEYLEGNLDALVSDVEMLMGKGEAEILAYAGGLLTANCCAVGEVSMGSMVVSARFTVKQSYSAFEPSSLLAGGAAAKEGARFKERLQYAVCTNRTLYDLFGNSGSMTVKEVIQTTLSYVVPLVVSATAAATPAAGFLTGIVAAALALILKIGYAAYCSVYWEENPTVLNNFKNKGGIS